MLMFGLGSIWFFRIVPGLEEFPALEVVPTSPSSSLA